ncbi:MAG TPA: nuclear transport factor 2 family protein [Longimicrobium sp.]|jgi:ketosteroid isomerase-like protein|uniref:nuclear transport factor 2 family protein n=1 Tax=Longimicrobium sp. TaxID=2029185 RepID=UPI002EDA9BB7
MTSDSEVAEALLAHARGYLRAIEDGATGDRLAAFFTADVVQEEFPNRLVAAGARRDLAALLQGAERGHAVLRGQTYEIVNEVQSGSTVVLEVNWTGTLAIPIGALPAGGQMKARFAVFLEYRDGRIARQRNYDCFDPW